jgi:hypothetical protein
MTRKRNIGGVAAIGGATAVIALLTGLPGAQADELADLRANQQLLQQRIDQLAQAQAQAGPGAPGGYPTGGSGPVPAFGAAAPPGSGTTAGSFPRSFLIPGTDTSIRVGGFVDITALDFLQGGGAVPGSNASSNSGQNGNIQVIPVGEAFVPGAPAIAGIPGSAGIIPQAANHSKGNGVFEFSTQQTRINIETRTPTAWGESRTFFEMDWAGCDNFSCQTLGQGGGDSLLPRLRYAYGTLGGFLAGQAISNFSDADADTESMEFGGALGSTGGMRIPQIRYTIAGPYGSAFSVSAENPYTALVTPFGGTGSDLATSGTGTTTSPTNNIIGATCNGVACTGAGTAGTNPGKQNAPTLTAASYWSQPWGHVDAAGVMLFPTVQDGKFFDRQFIGYGGHFAGDVHPNWFGWAKDDFLFSFVAGEGIGDYASGGDKTLFQLATNFTVPTACKTATKGCMGGLASSNILVDPVFAFSTNGGYQHWWTPSLRSTIAAGMNNQDVNSQLIGPTQSNAINKEQWNAFVNLVWNPVAFITTGVEYMYGKRIVVSNANGHEQVLIGKFRVAF